MRRRATRRRSLLPRCCRGTQPSGAGHRVRGYKGEGLFNGVRAKGEHGADGDGGLIGCGDGRRLLPEAKASRPESGMRTPWPAGATANPVCPGKLQLQSGRYPIQIARTLSALVNA